MVCGDAPDLPSVDVLGRLTDVELADRYRRAWVFCLPSTYEGFGVPYIEAMASGLPVVATPNVGAREVLGDGRYGDLVDDAGLGPALVALLDDATRRAELEAAGLERSRDYDWPSVVSSYEAVYRELLAHPRRQATAHRRPIAGRA
jgi:glycosyltransferase involved in cell wall biosynthesis